MVAAGWLGGVRPEHEAGMKVLAGLWWCTWQFLRRYHEVVVGDLLLDGVYQIIRWDMGLAARLRLLSNHHSEALSVGSVMLEALGIFEVKILSATARALGADEHVMRLTWSPICLFSWSS